MASIARNVRLLLNIQPSVLRRSLCRFSAVSYVHNRNQKNSLCCGNLHKRLEKISPSILTPSLRHYGTKKPLTEEEITERVMKVLKEYDKITADKLTVDSHFLNDLGLDSLDQVEIIMAMEDEFFFEIPDSDADRLMRPKDIVQYIVDKEDVIE